MALYLTEDDVGRLLPVDACMAAVEEAFRQWAEGRASNRPRARVPMTGGMLHTLSAASDLWGRMAAKVYATTRAGARFVVLLFDGRTSELLAVIDADRLGQIRTGAASAVATRYLALPNAGTLAVLGSGWQARGQVRAIAAARRLKVIRASGRDRERLIAFCREMEESTGVPVTAAPSAEAAVRGADIVVTATSAARPVLSGDWLEPGTHVNAVGSNRIDRRELDDDVLRHAALIVVDSIDQARLEAGDLVGGALERSVELSAIVAGGHPGRAGAEDITLFKSLGLGLEDLAAATLVYDRAVAAGAGETIP